MFVVLNFKVVVLYTTHPFATKKFPFNLHVLSILLAFILSQDQTQIN